MDKLDGIMRKKPKLPCSSCGKLIVSYEDANKHPVLNTLMCLSCFNSYELAGDLSKYRGGVDINGKDNYCRWCLDGGELNLCSEDNCHNGFCNFCITRNLGVKALDDIKELQAWYCFVCDYTQLENHRAKTESFLRSLRPAITIKKQKRVTIQPPVECSENRLKQDKQPTVSAKVLNTNISRSDPAESVANKSQKTNGVSTLKSPDVNISANDLTESSSSRSGKPSGTPKPKVSFAFSLNDKAAANKSHKTKEVMISKAPVIIDPVSDPIDSETNKSLKTKDVSLSKDSVINNPVSDPIESGTNKSLKTKDVSLSKDSVIDNPVNDSSESGTNKSHRSNGILKTKVPDTAILKPVDHLKKPKVRPPTGFSLGIFSTSRLFQAPKPQPIPQPPDEPSKCATKTDTEKVKERSSSEEVPMNLEEELYLSDDSSMSVDTRVEAFEDTSTNIKTTSESENTRKWAVQNALLLRKRLKVYLDSLSESYETFDEEKFLDDPSNLVSWLDNIGAYLKGSPLIEGRIDDIHNFLTISDE